MEFKINYPVCKNGCEGIEVEVRETMNDLGEDIVYYEVQCRCGKINDDFNKYGTLYDLDLSNGNLTFNEKYHSEVVLEHYGM